MVGLGDEWSHLPVGGSEIEVAQQHNDGLHLYIMLFKPLQIFLDIIKSHV